MFGFRNRKRPRAAARTASAVRAAVAPVVAECLEERLVFSALVSVWVDTPRGTYEGAPPEDAGKFTFHAIACTGSGAPASVTVTFQLSGTAEKPGQCGGSGDYTGDLTTGTVDVPVNGDPVEVTFIANDDLEVEDPETVIVTLDDGGSSYSVPDPGVTGREATAGIADNDVNVSVEATDGDASENDNHAAVFTIYRDGGLGNALTVYYTLGGTATWGVVGQDGVLAPADADYVATQADSGGYRSVRIPAGQTSTTVTVVPRNDPLQEPTETVELTLVADRSVGGPFYNPPGQAGPATANATITDLRVKIDPDWEGGHEPTTEELNAVTPLFPQLDDDEFSVRESAKQTLLTKLRANPGLKPTYVNARQTLNENGRSDMDYILTHYQVVTDIYFDDQSRLHVVHNSDDLGPAGTAYVVLYAYPDFTPPLGQEQTGPVYIELPRDFTDGASPRRFIPQSAGDAVVTVVIEYRNADLEVIDEMVFTLPSHVYEA